jgi:hypothetical protein
LHHIASDPEHFARVALSGSDLIATALFCAVARAVTSFIC